ncbi:MULTISPECIES: hypothetical protein [unclassified Mesorhizobium]|uniref:hypothetical protein n=1 Tax=unclassified Mesorhizobium TaxID=325217 RepID=UPI0003CF494E|nr:MULTISPECIES: hypothetical protein [unclassified Mesorhizobium]ESY48146.1 hypothetical protein X745_28950 [Mesorhizobium sp. LNJC374B00]ESY52210.1 hypothetical protein X744_29310 [Mesorhizobium sp. LNJC372A00]WJI81133.1 hypothetical protein NLY34_31495 [Mesorhizobium sp. C374B]WJI87675.1 hypothetical protein NLY42_02230 [Mesorhizobium sp. C372A]
MRVRVCDDDASIAEDWVAAIKAVVPAQFDVDRMAAAKDDVSNLLRRKLAVEDGADPLGTATGFDGIDILVVDYDLLHLDDAGSRTTGEGVARLARSLSTCGAIVVMNQYKGPQFDLGMRGHLDSFAEVNIEASLVGKPALWQAIKPGASEFNPTTWTPMPALLEAGRGLASKFASEGLDFPIMPLLGLDAGALAELSDTAFGFVSPKAQTAEELAVVTLREFVGYSLDADFASHLSETAANIVYAFAAFRLVKWLDRAVLRPMDVLVDAAHLLDRLPFMIDPDKADPSDSSSWAKAIGSPQDSLRWDLLEKYHNPLASSALGKPVFDWFRLAEDDLVDEMQDKYLEGQPSRFFLAEDTSRFVEKGALTRFRADFHNFGDRRGIEKIDGISYGPLRRIRFG